VGSLANSTANSTASSPRKQQQEQQQGSAAAEQQQQQEEEEEEDQQQAVPESALKALDILRVSEDLYDICGALGLDVHNGSGSTVHVQPRGLVNTGNTCFLNASAQVRGDAE
jgi:ubiquitin C-terminal hydrolase